MLILQIHMQTTESEVNIVCTYKISYGYGLIGKWTRANFFFAIEFRYLSSSLATYIMPVVEMRDEEWARTKS